MKEDNIIFFCVCWWISLHGVNISTPMMPKERKLSLAGRLDTFRYFYFVISSGVRKSTVMELNHTSTCCNIYEKERASYACLPHGV
jgi:hypothetical protein